MVGSIGTLKMMGRGRSSSSISGFVVVTSSSGVQVVTAAATSAAANAVMAAGRSRPIVTSSKHVEAEKIMNTKRVE